MKIRNHLTFPMILLGAGYQGWRGAWAEGVGGFLLGFLPLLVLFWMGGMGAGDVKFGAGIGVWLGVEGMVRTYAFSALVLLFYLLVSGKLGEVLRNTLRVLVRVALRAPSPRTTRIPYGVFLGMGAWLALWTGG